MLDKNIVASVIKILIAILVFVAIALCISITKKIPEVWPDNQKINY